MLLVKAKLLQASATINHAFSFQIDQDSLASFSLEIPADVNRYITQLASENALALAHLPGLDFVGVVVLTSELKSARSKSKNGEALGEILQVLTDSQTQAVYKKLAKLQLEAETSRQEGQDAG